MFFRVIGYIRNNSTYRIISITSLLITGLFELGIFMNNTMSNNTNIIYIANLLLFNEQFAILTIILSMLIFIYFLFGSMVFNRYKSE